MTTKMTDTAASAAIGAATRDLHLPAVRNEADRLAQEARQFRMLVRPNHCSRSLPHLSAFRAVSCPSVTFSTASILALGRLGRHFHNTSPV